ncbi:MAG TPA: SCO family protein [Mycobacteriales bacterium]|nr:SCO family protein [Mycobacteriales bacterium]
MSETGRVQRRWGTAALALLALSAVASCGRGGDALSGPSPTPVAYHGVEPKPVPTRPSWVLTDTNGKRYDFRAQTDGHPTFVYFGYTNCPDECPTAMADIAAALRKTTPAVRAEVRVVFVTTDVRRDTAPVLRRWLDQFSDEFVGVLGTQAEVDAAQEATGITPAFPDGVVPTLPGRPDDHVHKPGTAAHEHFGPLGYAVTHSAVIFAYDAADRLPVVYPGGVTPSDIVADLPVLAHP